MSAVFRADCLDCECAQKFRLETNRNTWAYGHEWLMAVEGERHRVVKTDNLPKYEED